MAGYWVIATPPPPPDTHTHIYFVWETPRWRRHSLEFPVRFFNRMTHESRHEAIQFFGREAV